LVGLGVGRNVTEVLTRVGQYMFIENVQNGAVCVYYVAHHVFALCHAQHTNIILPIIGDYTAALVNAFWVTTDY